MSTERDEALMALALDEARAAATVGDYPVGAALVVDGTLWGTARNALFSEGCTTAHAEHALIATHSAALRATLARNAEVPIELYTTLEPCLMCFGTAVLHRVSRIVVACPDPHGGATRLDRAQLGSAYTQRWPQVVPDPFRRESCELIVQFLRTDRFRSAPVMLPDFLALQQEGV